MKEDTSDSKNLEKDLNNNLYTKKMPDIYLEHHQVKILLEN